MQFRSPFRNAAAVVAAKAVATRSRYSRVRTGSSPKYPHETALMVHAGGHRRQDVVKQTLGLVQKLTVRNDVIQQRERERRILQPGDQRSVLPDVALEQVAHALHRANEGPQSIPGPDRPGIRLALASAHVRAHRKLVSRRERVAVDMFSTLPLPPRAEPGSSSTIGLAELAEPLDAN